MKRLVYADTFGTGEFHETFNSSSLKMMSCIFDEVIYYSTSSSGKVIKKILGQFPPNIITRTIYIPIIKGKVGNFLHLLFSFLWNIYIICKVNKSDVVFYNYNSLWAMSFINWYCKNFHKKVIIMCHGEMEFLLTNTKLNYFSDKMLHKFQSDKFDIAQSLYFCVLGESIKRNLSLVVSKNLLEHFISFEHTFIPPERLQDYSTRNDGILKVGTVGTIRQFKGLNHVIQLAEELKKNPKIKFYAIGRIFCDTNILSSVGIKYIPGSENDFVAKSILDKYIDKMDVLVFLYPEEKYKLTASGAIFDAIAHRKYILSLHNDYFDSLFKRVKIGQQFESIDAMAAYINNIHNMKTIDYTIVYKLLNPKVEAVKFKQQLEHIHFI